MSVRGYVMQLQPFSVNDGDGIRTTVFIAGCPLRCRWCSNPEGFTCEEKIGWYERRCVGCGACSSVCPEGIGINMDPGRSKCTSCGKCVDVCPANARAKMVSLMDAEDIISQIHKHRLFYSYSGGGITFSGGEATGQPEFLDYLSSRLYDLGYSMDIETSGYFDFDKVRSSLERMDLIFMDIKHMDPEKHRYYTGVSNDVILRNVARLNELPAEKVIRIPVIAGVNADEDNIRRTAAYVHEHLKDAKMELLPYHRFGMIKYEALGIRYNHPEFRTPSKEDMDHLKNVVSSEGVEIAEFR